MESSFGRPAPTTPDANDGDAPCPTGRVLLLLLALSTVFAGLYALSRSEVTQFHRLSMECYFDYQGVARHRLADTAESTHSLNSIIIGKDKTFPSVAVTALTRAGMPLLWSVTLMAWLFRTLFAMGIAIMLFAATRKWYIAALGVLLAFSLPDIAPVYGHVPHKAIRGICGVSLFVIAAALCVLGRRWSAAGVWLVLGAMHPVTFVCWTPVMLGLLFWRKLTAAVGGRLSGAYMILLVVAPTVLGLVAALAEARGVIPLRGGQTYWALTRIRAWHTTFFFSGRWDVPLGYFSQVACLYILARSPRTLRSPLAPFNRLAAAGGLGIGLMYLICVETELSVVAAVMYPLRFESVMCLLIVANVFEVMFRRRRDGNADAWFAVGYGATLLMPGLKPLVGAWAWATGSAYLQARRSRRIRWVGVGVVGVSVTVLYAALIPRDESLSMLVRLKTLRYLATSLPPLAGALIVALLVGRLGLTVRRVAVSALVCVGIVCLMPGTWGPSRLQAIGEEASAIAKGTEERTPHKELSDWMNEHIPAGTPVLSHYGINLHKTTHVKTSINHALLGAIVYFPAEADEQAREIRDIYGLDVVDMADRRQILLRQYDWGKARATVLEADGGNPRGYRYVVELATEPAAGGADVAFENALARVYETP